MFTIPESPNDPFWKTVSHQPDSLFMNLPYDVLILFKEWLPRENQAMLALTCKSAMDLYYPKTPLVWDEITHVRRLMELSVSDRLYYCWDCTYLHHLDRLDPKEWRIRAREHGYSQPSLRRPDPNNPNHTKKFLIMNEHLYGPGRGIALSPGFIEATTIGDWSLKPSVAILDGQLFLSVRYAITVRGPLLQGWPHMKGFKFCHHLQDSQEFWGPQPGVHGLPGLQMLRGWWQSGGARMPSRTHMQGHCDLCLTDYTERTKDFQEEHMSFLYAGHAPGSVKKRWERGVAAKRKQIRASGKTSA
ncbi:hypothetical protein PGQ11_001553 [Apiospora arundinis]|uniref:F-box domain-containing protein n=1 Tax=Apiospora arundinis TaxID=335852 RepID=A0ABR2JN69_9PEZI